VSSPTTDDHADRVDASVVGPSTSIPPPLEHELLRKARAADIEHRRRHHRPIAAETLRKQLHVGATRSRMLAAAVRTQGNPHPLPGGDAQKQRSERRS